jgi:hypothetical protein
MKSKKNKLKHLKDQKKKNISKLNSQQFQF